MATDCYQKHKKSFEKKDAKEKYFSQEEKDKKHKKICEIYQSCTEERKAS